MKRPLRPCSVPGCPELSRTGRCARHAARTSEQDRKAAYDSTRPSAAARGYGSRWQKARLGFLKKHPICCHCEAEGITTPATVVDHIVPHQGDKALFWDRSNWQPLCKRHHDIKTATEDSAFAGPRRRG